MVITCVNEIDGVKIVNDAAELLPLEGSNEKYGSILLFQPRTTNTFIVQDIGSNYRNGKVLQEHIIKQHVFDRVSIMILKCHAVLLSCIRSIQIDMYV